MSDGRPNDVAHLPGRLAKLHITIRRHAAPVGCSALFGADGCSA